MKWLIWIKCLVAAPSFLSFQISNRIELNRSDNWLKKSLAKQLAKQERYVAIANLFITCSYQFHFLFKHLINLFQYIDIKKEKKTREKNNRIILFQFQLYSIQIQFIIQCRNLNLNFFSHFYTWKTVAYLLQILKVRAIQ